MRDQDIAETQERYRKRWLEYGYDRRKYGWNKDCQWVRFEAAFEGLRPDEFGSVLDVGCGFGDLSADCTQYVTEPVDKITRISSKCNRHIRHWCAPTSGEVLPTSISRRSISIVARNRLSLRFMCRRRWESARCTVPRRRRDVDGHFAHYLLWHINLSEVGSAPRMSRWNDVKSSTSAKLPPARRGAHPCLICELRLLELP